MSIREIIVANARDYIEVNLLSVLTIVGLTLAEVKDLAAVAVAIVSIICTALITRQKLKSKKGDE